MTHVLVWIGVAVLGAFGALERFQVGNAIAARRPSNFPYGTFIVNLSGAFALGVLIGLSVTGDALLVLGTGFLGAYTTFSTWMVEAQRLGENGDWQFMCLYLFGSMLAGLGTAGLGWLLGGAIR
jgi:CrcB protein